MGDLTANNKSNTAGFTLDSASGKALSRARREAMSRGGKAALGQVKAAPSVNAAASSRPAVSNPRKPVETISMPPVKDVAAAAEKTEPACGCAGADGKTEAERENAIDDICSIVADEPGVVVGEIASAVRKLCQERRRALSSQGKKAVKAMSMKAAAGAGLTGRAAARARREDLCANGRGNDAACRPSGRVRPEVAANKVEFGTTLSGTTVSGSQLERNSKITGVEAGTCRAITGTEYIGAEQYGALCSSTPSPSPAKVGVGMTGRGQRVSGVDTGRGDKVTGTELAANKTVTGNEYLGADKLEAKAASRQAPDKVGMSATRSGSNVSGTVVGRSVKVTGDEHGSCSAISGTEYTGSEQFESFCDAAQQAASRALMISRGAHAGTGSSIDAGNKVTGAERGESITLSGTPYSTTSQRVSQRGANNNPHPLARGPANAPREAAPAKQSPIVQGAFSIVTPARTSQVSNANKISGTAYGAIGRITGPVNLATGLVSGTPEFRYQDGIAPITLPVKSAPTAVDSVRNRLTGDGREGGFAITGAAWRRNESITGTEGAFTQRNQTIRGEQRNPMVGAAQLKERERPELPASKITGSSGNDAKGSAITYSGGARG
jgi:hypothetical protein